MSRICFIAALLVCSHVFAAAPKLDWLYPAGVGSGATTTLTASDGAAWPVRVWIDQPEGITIESHADKGKLTVTTAADAQPGVRWVRLINGEGASALRPLIIGTLPEVEEKEPNNSIAQVVALPAIINGRLDKNGDADVFRVTLAKDQTLIASLTANQILASAMDGIIQVCDGQGFVLVQNDDANGLDPQVVFKVPRDGEYIVRTFAFPATPSSSINYAGGIDFIYRLTLTTGGFADHALPMAVAQDKPTEVAIAGWNLTAETLKLMATPQADRDTVLLFHPKLGNTLVLPVSPWPLVVADAGNSIASPQAVTVPAVISGRIDSPHGAHAYRFDAVKSQKLHLRVESQALGYPLDPVLRVTDAMGKELHDTDDTAKDRDPLLALSPPADAAYVVSVRDLHGRGGERFAYRLTVAPIVPDYSVTLAADTFTTSAGKAVEIAVAVERIEGFDGEISISIEGLPEGAAAPAVISKPKDASAKAVKLNITTATGPWSGPIRIIASSRDTRRIATFATAGESRHHQAWLTVTKPGEKAGDTK